MLKIAGFTSLLLCLHAAHAAAGDPPAGPNAGLKIIAREGEKEKAMVMVLPDGRIAGWKDPGPAGPDGKNPPLGTPMGRISGNAIVDTNGTLLVKYEADGAIVVGGMKGKPRFNAANEMLDDDGVRTLWLMPDGTPILNMNGTPGPLPFKVEGVTDGNRRMAMLLVLLMMAPKEVKSTTPALAHPKDAPAAGKGAAQ